MIYILILIFNLNSGLYDNSSLDSLLDASNQFSSAEGELTSTSPNNGGQIVRGHQHSASSHSEGGLSLTNLSQDSGLTTSDSQLYAFEEDHHSFSSEEFDPNMLVPGSKESSRVS